MKNAVIAVFLALMLWSEAALAAGQVSVLWDWQAPGEKATRLADQDKLPGVDVLSPSWFVIADERGRIKDKRGTAHPEYVRKAHGRGYKVWALITNDFNPDMTKKLLASPMGRANAVREMKALAKEYGLDGINIDFENIYPEDRDSLTDFVAEISRALRAEGLTVSMDITIPSSSGMWSRCYDRRALAEQVDYLMLMAYDEHGAASSVSGSVASLDWVEKGIAATLSEGVPPEKLVLGMPLYMRIWQEDIKTGKAKGKTLSMSQAEKLIADRKLSPVWLAGEGQYYFEYTEGKKRYRVWQENRRSLALKAALISRYDLAGSAYWRSTLETADVWEALAQVIAAGRPVGAGMAEKGDADNN
ncbi:glycosyl hydrolase family 18 protein [Anaerovibrio sp.]|uniref:glycosyl hydrolase family 18 protein n=1 Tax=Anaerovibrio sp. TaxID=1872532 RepID=UPI003F17923C